MEMLFMTTGRIQLSNIYVYGLVITLQYSKRYKCLVDFLVFKPFMFFHRHKPLFNNPLMRTYS